MLTQVCIFYFGKKCRLYFSILVVSVEFVWRQKGYVFFGCVACLCTFFIRKTVMF